MGAPVEIYVDPAIAGDSGAGTIGDPYGDLQYALNTATRDATHGNRFNIKAGTDEILAAALSLTTYGTPSLTAPLIFQGYTGAAGDGGIGGISGGGSVAVWASMPAYVSMRDLVLHNTGSAAIVTFGGFANNLVACVIHNTTGNGVVFSTSVGQGVIGCHLYDIGTIGVVGAPTADALVARNYFANGTKSFTVAIGGGTMRGLQISRNVISIGGASNGIDLTSYSNLVEHNAILSAGGTGKGITNSNGGVAARVINNLAEGFSGSGGVGIHAAAGNEMAVYGHNAVFNCATAYSLDDVRINLGDNETLSATPFAKSGSNTFANRGTYFAPVDTGNVWGGAYPTELGLDKGAVQHVAVSAGGGGRRRRLVTVS